MFFFALTLFVLAVSAASQASDPAFEITNLTIRKVAMGNTTIQFTVYDPDPLTNATQLCTGSWKAGSRGFPQGGYEMCGNSTFAWNMQTFTNLRTFHLGIEHSYNDSSVGSAPYNEVSNFGNANITEPAAVECKTTSGLFVCHQINGTSIKAPIYATIAKRR